MEWIPSEFRSVEEVEDVFPPELLSAMRALNIHTLEEVVALSRIEGMRTLMAQSAGVDRDRIEELVVQSANAIPEKRDADLLRPLNEEDLADCSFGLLEPADHSRYEERQDVGEAKAFHAGLDVSEVNHIPRLKPVQNQGRRGTCVAFGTTAVREFFGGDREDKLAEQYLYWGAKQRDGHPDSSGTWIRYAVKCLEEEGQCRNETWPYNPEPGETEHQGPPPGAAREEAGAYRILKGIPITGNAVDSMRAVLAGSNGRPGRVISFGIPVFKSWRSNPITYRTGRIPMPLPGESHIGGHCMTLVGYKDDESWPGGGYFIFRNSWGTSWARESEFGPGHGTVPYAFIAEHGWEAWSMEVDQKEEKGMAGKGFGWKATILGILLGLLVVGTGVFFHPELLDFRWESDRAAEPERAEETVTAVIESQEEPEPPKAGEAEEQPAGVQTEPQTGKQPLPSGEEETQAASPRGEVAEEKAAAPQGTAATGLEVPSYYADEEKRWKALLEQPFNEELVAAYPHGDCFRAAAADHALPLPLVLGLAAYLSNFDPQMRFDRGWGVMRVGWPSPAKNLGAVTKEALVDEPCRNIQLGCSLLASLMEKADGEVVPALAAYRDQSIALHIEQMDKTDLAFSAAVRRKVEDVLEGPYRALQMVPLLAFDQKQTAWDFMSMVRQQAELELWMGQEKYRYMVYLPESSSENRVEKLKKIKEATGLSLGSP